MTASAASMTATLAIPTTDGTATTGRERISAIDTLRGFALLGILVLNINYFAGPEAGHDIPYDVFAGPHGPANLVTFYVKWIFFEAKMRGMFSMLFGAGVILMTSRAERRGAGQDVADIYLRRNILLLLFGLIHGVLIWDGDILFDYALSALLLLYPLRKLPARTLFLTGTFLSLVVSTWTTLVFIKFDHNLSVMHQAAAAEARQHAGQPITAAEKKISEEWHKTVESHQPTAARFEKKVAKVNRSYWEVVAEHAKSYTDDLFHDHILAMMDWLSAMMIGMALMKAGFLTGELSYRTYIMTALVGAAISIPLYVVGLAQVVASHLDFMVIDEWLFLPYYLTREAGMLAITAALIIIIKSGRLPTARRLLAAVGQTALTNYLVTSVICQLIFVWGPWKLYGHLEYYQLNYVTLGVWAFNLVFSTLWLRAFAFGPVEWVWRSLTYLKIQPMRYRARAVTA
jgi:uncharacterized protein